MDGSEPLYCLHMDDAASCVCDLVQQSDVEQVSTAPALCNLFGPVEAAGVGCALSFTPPFPNHSRVKSVATSSLCFLSDFSPSFLSL